MFNPRNGVIYTMFATIGTVIYNTITGENLGIIGAHQKTFNAASKVLSTPLPTLNSNPSNSSLATIGSSLANMGSDTVKVIYTTSISNTLNEAGELLQNARQEYITPAINAGTEEVKKLNYRRLCRGEELTQNRNCTTRK